MKNFAALLCALTFLLATSSSNAVCFVPTSDLVSTSITTEPTDGCDEANALPSIDAAQLQTMVDSVQSLYDGAGNTALWYLREKLESGDIYEVFAVIRLFERNRVFPLLQDIIAVSSRYNSETTTPGSEARDRAAWIEGIRGDALTSTARYFGLWDSRYRSMYPAFDTESWRALFYETMENSPALFQ